MSIGASNERIIDDDLWHENGTKIINIYYYIQLHTSEAFLAKIELLLYAVNQNVYSFLMFILLDTKVKFKLIDFKV